MTIPERRLLHLAKSAIRRIIGSIVQARSGRRGAEPRPVPASSTSHWSQGRDPGPRAGSTCRRVAPCRPVRIASRPIHRADRHRHAPRPRDSPRHPIDRPIDHPIDRPRSDRHDRCESAHRDDATPAWRLAHAHAPPLPRRSTAHPASPATPRANPPAPSHAALA